MDKELLVKKLQKRLKDVQTAKAEALAQVNALSGQAYEVEMLLNELLAEDVKQLEVVK